VTIRHRLRRRRRTPPGVPSGTMDDGGGAFTNARAGTGRRTPDSGCARRPAPACGGASQVGVRRCDASRLPSIAPRRRAGRRLKARPGRIPERNRASDRRKPVP
jgi:hypothetical protein